MSKLLYYSIAWPFELFGAVVEFLVWVFFSDGRWRQRKVQPNPAKHLQDEAIEAARELREFQYKSRREMEERESWFREELKRKEREILLSQRS